MQGFKFHKVSIFLREAFNPFYHPRPYWLKPKPHLYSEGAGLVLELTQVSEVMSVSLFPPLSLSQVTAPLSGLACALQHYRLSDIFYPPPPTDNKRNILLLCLHELVFSLFFYFFPRPGSSPRQQNDSGGGSARRKVGRLRRAARCGAQTAAFSQPVGGVCRHGPLSGVRTLGLCLTSKRGHEGIPPPPPPPLPSHPLGFAADSSLCVSVCLSLSLCERESERVSLQLSEGPSSF